MWGPVRIQGDWMAPKGTRGRETFSFTTTPDSCMLCIARSTLNKVTEGCLPAVLQCTGVTATGTASVRLAGPPVSQS